MFQLSPGQDVMCTGAAGPQKQACEQQTAPVIATTGSTSVAQGEPVHLLPHQVWVQTATRETLNRE